MPRTTSLDFLESLNKSKINVESAGNSNNRNWRKIITAPFHINNRNTHCCHRCGGSGYLPQYYYIAEGVCFSCNGSGQYNGISEKTKKLILPRTFRRWCIIINSDNNIVDSFTVDGDCDPSFKINNCIKSAGLTKNNVKVIFGNEGEKLSYVVSKIGRITDNPPLL